MFQYIFLTVAYLYSDDQTKKGQQKITQIFHFGTLKARYSALTAIMQRSEQSVQCNIIIHETNMQETKNSLLLVHWIYYDRQKTSRFISECSR